MVVIFDYEQHQWNYFSPRLLAYSNQVFFCGHIATTIKVTKFRTIPMK